MASAKAWPLPRAASDGRTVAWQSRTLAHGQMTWVIRTYELATGQRRLLAQGGSPTTFAYGWPGVSGRWVVFEKGTLTGQPARSQIWLADMSTGQLRALTPAREANSEPAIAGGAIAWKVGWRYEGGRGVAIYNRGTGTLKTLDGAGVETPSLTANGYAIYSLGNPSVVRLYNMRTGVGTILAGPGPGRDGYQPGNAVFAGEHAVAYTLGAASTAATPAPTHLVVTLLP